jgi:hypothetical protein
LNRHKALEARLDACFCNLKMPEIPDAYESGSGARDADRPKKHGRFLTIRYERVCYTRDKMHTS